MRRLIALMAPAWPCDVSWLPIGLLVGTVPFYALVFYLLNTKQGARSGAAQRLRGYSDPKFPWPGSSGSVCFVAFLVASLALLLVWAIWT